jgi:hypothetical protein
MPAGLLQQLRHQPQIFADMAEELLVACAEIMQPGLTLKSSGKPVLGTGPPAGSAVFMLNLLDTLFISFLLLVVYKS